MKNLLIRNLTAEERHNQEGDIKYSFSKEMEKLLQQAVDANQRIGKESPDGDVVYSNVIRKALSLLTMVRIGKATVEFKDQEKYFITDLK